MCMCVCVCDLQNGLGRRPPASAAGPAPAEWQSGPQARRPHPGAVFRQQGNRQPFSPQATVPRRRPPVRSAAGLFCFVCVLGTISRAGVFVSSHLAVLTGFVWVCLCTDGCGGIESGGGGTEGTAGDAACVDLFWWTHVLACLFVWCRGVAVLLFWNPTLTYRISRVVFVQATAVQRQRRQLRRLRPPCVPRAVVFFNGCNAGSEDSASACATTDSSGCLNKRVCTQLCEICTCIVVEPVRLFELFLICCHCSISVACLRSSQNGCRSH
jgi:hypothetical protein